MVGCAIATTIRDVTMKYKCLTIRGKQMSLRTCGIQRFQEDRDSKADQERYTPTPGRPRSLRISDRRLGLLRAAAAQNQTERRVAVERPPVGHVDGWKRGETR
jgi:hypothetical protein